MVPRWKRLTRPLYTRITASALNAAPALNVELDKDGAVLGGRGLFSTVPQGTPDGNGLRGLGHIVDAQEAGTPIECR